MGKVVMSMSGEGRGHATRARALAEALAGEHDVLLLAPGDAWELLQPAFEGSAVRVERLPGLRFRYRRDGRLDYGATAWHSLGYLRRLPALVGDLARRLERERPDLVLTDFEPALPRAARRVGLPFVSLTHQHVLAVGRFPGIDRELERHVRWMGAFVRNFYRGADLTLVSSFYEVPLREDSGCVGQVGVLLREQVRRARPRDGEHLVAYLRREPPPAVLQGLAACGRPVCIYGLGARARRGNLTFLPLSERGFVEDLASCHALVCTAGNQLVGEAVHLCKPVLALPEPGNQEQRLNAWFVQRLGIGLGADPEALEPATLERFLDARETFLQRLPQHDRDGLPQVLEALRPRLGGASLAAPAAPARSTDLPLPDPGAHPRPLPSWTVSP